MAVPQQWVELQDAIRESDEFHAAFDNMSRGQLLELIAANWVMLIVSFRAMGQELDWRQWMDGFSWELRWQES